MSDICKDREALRPKYEQFVQTERGKEWKHFWQSQTGSERSGDFGDYLQKKCKDCGKYHFSYIKDWNQCNKFIAKYPNKEWSDVCKPILN